MKKWAITTFVVAIIAFLLGPQIWTHPMGSPTPTSSQIPFFILMSLIESISLGLGISFLIFGYPLAKMAVDKSPSNNLAMLLYLSIAWSLVNWWFHDGLHMSNGMDLQGLLFIEYGFHLTLIIAASIIAYCFFHSVLITKSK